MYVALILAWVQKRAEFNIYSHTHTHVQTIIYIYIYMCVCVCVCLCVCVCVCVTRSVFIIKWWEREENYIISPFLFLSPSLLISYFSSLRKFLYSIHVIFASFRISSSFSLFCTYSLFAFFFFVSFFHFLFFPLFRLFTRVSKIISVDWRLSNFLSCQHHYCHYVATIFNLCKFVTPVSSGYFSLRSEWQQVFSDLPYCRIANEGTKILVHKNLSLLLSQKGRNNCMCEREKQTERLRERQRTAIIDTMLKTNIFRAILLLAFLGGSLPGGCPYPFPADLFTRWQLFESLTESDWLRDSFVFIWYSQRPHIILPVLNSRDSFPLSLVYSKTQV